jgi:hypothetical protein
VFIASLRFIGRSVLVAAALLQVILVLAHERRKILHFDIIVDRLPEAASSPLLNAKGGLFRPPCTPKLLLRPSSNPVLTANRLLYSPRFMDCRYDSLGNSVDSTD